MRGPGDSDVDIADGGFPDLTAGRTAGVVIMIAEFESESVMVVVMIEYGHLTPDL